MNIQKINSLVLFSCNPRKINKNNVNKTNEIKVQVII